MKFSSDQPSGTEEDSYLRTLPDGCPWCLDPNAIEPDSDEGMCLTHRAEYQGLTVNELKRRESTEYAEWDDTRTEPMFQYGTD